MTDPRPTGDDVTLGTKADLDQVLGWLEREFGEGVNDFWYNQGLIARALDNGDFYVIQEDGEAVAFQIGDYSPDIANVRQDKQGQGFGTALLEASVARARRDHQNILDVECAPASSVTFWEKHGFERYSNRGQFRARRILHRFFQLPPELPRVPVTVAFYPERAIYGRGDEIDPIALHEVEAVCHENGSLMLDRRVICADNLGGDGDLAVKIEVDGELRCFEKTKNSENAGVVWDRRGGAFYLDAVEPRGEMVPMGDKDGHSDHWIISVPRFEKRIWCLPHRLRSSFGRFKRDVAGATRSDRNGRISGSF